MKDVAYLDRFEQAEALLKPTRVEVLRRLAEPRSCTEVGAALGQSPQKIYYHVKRLEEAGLVEQVSERRVRGIHEGIYQAVARAYWLSPRLVGTIGRRRARDELSLGYLLDLVGEVQDDLASLAARDPTDGEAELPTVGISGEIRLTPAQRQAFLGELRATLEGLLSRYGGAAGDAFRIALACYPRGEGHDRER